MLHGAKFKCDMESSKRVKLSLRVNKEKKNADLNSTVSEYLEKEAAKHEFEGFEQSQQLVNDKINCSSLKQHNSNVISRPSRNVVKSLMTWTTWTPLPDLQCINSNDSVQKVKPSSENQTLRNADDSFSNQYTKVPKTEWIPLPVPCLRCVCIRSPSSRYKQSAAVSENDSALMKSSNLALSSREDKNADNTLPDVLSNPGTILSVDTKSVAVSSSSGNFNIKSRANISQKSEGHLSVKKESAVHLGQGLVSEHSTQFAFRGIEQLPHPSNSRILQKSHFKQSSTPVFLPKTSNMQTSKAVSLDGKLATATNKISSNSMPEPLTSTLNPAGSYSKKDCSLTSECRGLDSDVSLYRSHGTSCAKGQESNSILALQQCPLCAVQFESSLGQIQRDSHIAACLSAAEEDVVW